MFKYKILVLLLYSFMDTFSPSDLCLYKCNELEFRFSSKLFTGMIMEKENIFFPDGIKNAGISLHYIGV